MNFPRITAIVLNYNSSGETIGLYNNLLKVNYDSLEILVIDNASDQIDRQNLEKHIPVESIIFNSENYGYAGGNNKGIEYALQRRTSYVWILNPDIRVEENTLLLLLETIQKDPRLAAIGPRILKRENPEKIFSDGELLLWDEKCSTAQLNAGCSAKEIPGKVNYDIDYIDGSCILMKCAAIREIGQLPENYFLYFEETDWCCKAKRNNWKLAVNSNAIVYNLTSEKKAIFHYYFFRNRLIFAKKYHSNFKLVRKYYVDLLANEFNQRFKGKYLKPYYRSRISGLLAGILRTSLFSWLLMSYLHFVELLF